MKLLALIPLLLIGASAQAATIEIGTPQYIRPVGDQLYYFPADERAPPRVAWPGMENNARDINVPTSKGRLPVTVNQKTPVTLNKLAGAGLNLAKRAGPLGAGLTVAGLLCEFSDICSWDDPATPGAPPVFAVTDPDAKPFSYQRWEPPARVPLARFSTSTAVCDYTAQHLININAWQEASWSCVLNSSTTVIAKLRYRYPADPRYFIDQDAAAGNQVNYCPSTHTLVGSQCISNDPDRRLPLPPTGWPLPEDVPELNTPDIIPDLIEGGEPIPVDTPTIDPKTTPGPGGSTTETVRNGQGEPIGTKTTDTTVTITPSGPTTVNVTETTTITETNITNNTTTTTTQETTLPNNEDQSEKPKEDQDLEIDNVEDQDLDTHEIPDTFSYESWGGGSCPGDPTISANGYSYSLPVHTVCDAIIDMRPAVLLIAALVSAYIISGAFRQ